MQRRAPHAVALALGLASAISTGDAQGNRNVPGPDTPRLMIVVFQSSTRGLGVEVADAMRTRMTNNMNPRQLYVVPRELIVNFLESSGYKADSSLGTTDLRELARGLRADELVGGAISKNAAGGFRVEARLMLASDPGIGQPLPLIETNSLGDAGRQIERHYREARKQLADEQACKNHLRAAMDPNGKVINAASVDKAVASAQAGIVKYPNAVIARLCLANAYQANRMWDSVLSVTDQIRKIDTLSKLANQFAVEAYKQKADVEKDTLKAQQYRERAVQLLVALLKIDPTNQKLQGDVIAMLAQMGKPSVAIPIVEELLKQNPGDPPLLRTRWQLKLADAAASDAADTVTRQTKLRAGLTAGEEMARSDTTLADSTYWFRQVAAAISTTPQLAVEWTSRATNRYPANQDYWWYRANQERRAGQIGAASQSLSRLLALNPKYPSATLMLAQLYIDQKMMDSAIALARRSVAAGEARQTWGQVLIAPMNAQYVRAAAADSIAKADSTNRDKRAAATAEYESALALAQEVDKMSPSPHSKFFTAVSAYQIGVAAVNRVQATQTAMQRGAGTKQAPRAAEMAALRASACSDAKRAQDMFLLVQINMGGGGSVSPQAATAIMGAVPQYAPFVDEAARAFCRAARPAAQTPPRR